jgi:hypothetical protein
MASTSFNCARAAHPFQDAAARAGAHAKGQEEEQFTRRIASGNDERLGADGSPCRRDPRAAPLIGLEERARGVILESKPFCLETAEVAMDFDGDTKRCRGLLWLSREPARLFLKGRKRHDTQGIEFLLVRILPCR